MAEEIDVLHQEAFAQAALPANPLILEGAKIFRGFGSAHGVGNIRNAIRFSTQAQMTMQPDEAFLQLPIM